MDEQVAQEIDRRDPRPSALRHVIPGLAEAVKRGEAIDIAINGGVMPQESDGIETTLVVRIDSDAGPGALAELPGNRRFLLCRNMLHQVRDHRTILREAFSKLAVGGWLIVTVPHQFLHERKFRPPSRYGSATARFYTPGTLLLDVEAALDPTQYRVRLLRDDDEDYEYDAPIHRLATGRKRIVLAIEKIARPHWAGHMMDDDTPQVGSDRRGPVARADQGKATTNVIAPMQGPVQRILVLKLDHRGDYQIAEPALQLLRAHYPSAHITLVTGPWNLESAKAGGLFNEIKPLKFFAEDASTEGDPPREPLVREFARAFDKTEFDLVIDLRLLSDTRELLEPLRARHKAGIDNWNAFPWLDIRLSLPSPTVEGRIEQGYLSLDNFESRNHPRGAPVVQFRHEPAPNDDLYVVWGPYCTLGPGEYEFEFLIDCLANEQNLKFDIVYDAGNRMVTAGTFRCTARETSYKTRLHISHELSGVEFRLRPVGDEFMDFRFNGVRFRRSGQFVGVHQREAMLLLVNLVALRLAEPYQAAVF